MRKLYISIFIVSAVFLLGCSMRDLTGGQPGLLKKEKIPKATSLSDAYFTIIDTLEIDKKLKVEYFDELMKSYDSSDYFEPGGKIMHYYKSQTNVHELLTVTYNSDEELEGIRYSNRLKEHDITLDCNIGDPSDQLSVYVRSINISLDAGIASLLDISDSALLSYFNGVSNSIQTMDELTVNALSDSLLIDPTLESSSGLSPRSGYVFKKGDESIILYCEEKSNNPYSVKYLKKNKDGVVEISKESSVIDAGSSDVISTINTYIVENIEKQKNALKELE